MSGLSVVGRDYYGVFRLKGKLLNVRDAGMTSVRNISITAVLFLFNLVVRHSKYYSFVL